MNMALIVYALCAVTSLTCAILLLRGYRRSRVRLLLWSGLCFSLFTLNGILLIIDARTPVRDLSVVRSLPLLLGVAVLLYGLVWEGEA
jgi:hypothetical protein